MGKSLHDVSDPRNASVLISVNGELKPRAEAVVSVFDSGFMLGDGVWEGMRVSGGKLAFLDRHLDRLFEGAKAIAMDVGIGREELTKRLYHPLDALPGSPSGRDPGDDRDHRRVQGTGPGRVRARAEAVHGPRPPR